jgi:hypothetical protein
MAEEAAGRGWRFPGLRTVMLLLAIALSLSVAVAKRPDNYSVVVNAATNILAGRNPYEVQPGLDFFKYSPLAGLLTAPFIALPVPIGIFFFVLAQALAFLWGFRRWSRAAGHDLSGSRKLLLVALASVALDLATSLQNCQVNAGIFALMLLAAAQYAEGKRALSGLVLSFATNLKLFPFTLAACLLTGFRGAFWLSFCGGLALWLVLPAAFLGLSRNRELYFQWLQRIALDRGGDLSMLNLGTFLELHFGLEGWLVPIGLLVGAAMGIGSLLLFRRREHERLNRFLLPLNGLYVLLFSHLSESPTSVLAVAGIFLIGASAATEGRRAGPYWCAFAVALALVPVFYSDLMPSVAQDWARAFHLKTVGYTFVFLANLVMLVVYQARTRPVSTWTKSDCR